MRRLSFHMLSEPPCAVFPVHDRSSQRRDELPEAVSTVKSASRQSRQRLGARTMCFPAQEVPERRRQRSTSFAYCPLFSTFLSVEGRFWTLAGLQIADGGGRVDWSIGPGAWSITFQFMLHSVKTGIPQSEVEAPDLQICARPIGLCNLKIK